MNLLYILLYIPWEKANGDNWLLLPPESPNTQKERKTQSLNCGHISQLFNQVLHEWLNLRFQNSSFCKTFFLVRNNNIILSTALDCSLNSSTNQPFDYHCHIQRKIISHLVLSHLFSFFFPNSYVHTFLTLDCIDNNTNNIS